ncbi:MAG: anti-sigma factor [Deltaproteobacteria bacterium]|nr:anti-sigma factor [Deltaproteobacteria bacterium]
MNCTEARPLLSSYLDNELDLHRSAEITNHLKSCADCADAHQLALAAQIAVKQSATYHSAPNHLRGRILANLPGAVEARPARKEISLSWLNFGAALASVAIVAVSLSLVFTGRSSEKNLVDDVIAAHVRSLMVDHLTDVASSDQHTVKPWFNSKVDFAPPVIDGAPQDFPLIGGRLDYVDKRAVAALVYRHDQHLINLFIWPAASAQDAPAKAQSTHGYNIVHWDRGGLRYWAVSDLNAAELMKLVELNR